MCTTLHLAAESPNLQLMTLTTWNSVYDPREAGFLIDPEDRTSKWVSNVDISDIEFHQNWINNV